MGLKTLDFLPDFVIHRWLGANPSKLWILCPFLHDFFAFPGFHTPSTVHLPASAVPD
jgi:hypothetical protein